MKGRDLLRISDLSAGETWRLLKRALSLKRQGHGPLLTGKSLALLFQKPSLRTRVSFEMAMHQLGGHAVYLSPAEVGLGERESAADVGRVLSRYVDAIAARTFSHADVEKLALHATVPTVNALSDLEHPCQALADMLTIWEKTGSLENLTLCFVGDGNNVSNSLLLAACQLGLHFRMAAPPGYQIHEDICTRAAEYAAASGSTIHLCQDPAEAVRESDVVYTDVWTSMGQEAETLRRRAAFSGYQVNSALLALARPGALVMHDLPAHRGEEITEEVIEGPQSVVFDQAENRLHAQKAVLVEILGG